ncbi:MAG: UbiA family prenyltransferase, partial [Thermoplasmata archaeon]|nr:UbiA family prenyltransferase [Thermoplasmata archaeon]
MNPGPPPCPASSSRFFPVSVLSVSPTERTRRRSPCLLTGCPTLPLRHLLQPERCVGGALAAGGANAINMVIDRDIDAVMKRTQNRPLVTGVITPRNALIFAIAV